MAEKDRASAAVGGAAVGSLLTYFLTKTAKAEAAPPGVDPQVWEMMLAVIAGIEFQSERLDDLTTAINNLVSTLGGVPVDREDPFENTVKFVTGHVICTVVGTAFQLPPIPVPKNKQVVVKALPGNITWMWVGASRGESQDINIAYPLVPNEGIGYLVENTDRIWVMAATLNDGVAFTVEQR